MRVILLIALLGLHACGDDEKATRDALNAGIPIESILGLCNQDNDGQTSFDDTTGKYFQCLSGQWNEEQ